MDFIWHVIKEGVFLLLWRNLPQFETVDEALASVGELHHNLSGSYKKGTFETEGTVMYQLVTVSANQ